MAINKIPEIEITEEDLEYINKEKLEHVHSDCNSYISGDDFSNIAKYAENKWGPFVDDDGTCALCSYFSICNQFAYSLNDASAFMYEKVGPRKEVDKVGSYVYRKYSYEFGKKSFIKRGNFSKSGNETIAGSQHAEFTKENTSIPNKEQKSIEEKPDYLKAVLKSRKKLFELKAKKVEFASPIIKREDIGIIYPNTINVIQAKDGMHKSRLAGIIGSSLLKLPSCKLEHLGFISDSLHSYTLLYVDTERNLRDQLPYALQQIQLQAGYELKDNPPNFDFISLLEFDRGYRLSILSDYLNYARKKYTNHVFIVLDVVTDCLSDFNNVKESLKLIDLMNHLINTYDVTFLCIIHENPNSEKARGNIGTEIINKASTALQLDFIKDSQGDSTNIIKVKYRKTRMSAKPAPFCMKYDAEQGLVLTCPEFNEPIKELCPIPEFIDFLEAHLIEPTLKEELFLVAMEKFKCKERTIEDRIKKIINDKEILYNKDGIISTLHRGRQGKQTLFKLNPINDEN